MQDPASPAEPSEPYEAPEPPVVWSAPPVPSAPPTPPVRLSELLGRADLGLGLRQVGGPPVDDSVLIQWVHTSEMEDPFPYLLGGELLLSAGIHFEEAAGSGSYLDGYVSRIVEAGGAALGFGIAPVHDTVPRALVEACERYGLPLLEVPQRTPFTAVARAVWRLMAEARHAELRRVTAAQQSLATAAARPDPVPAVLTRLAAALGGWAVLLAPDGTRIHTAGRAPAPDARDALSALTRVVNPRPAAEPGSVPPDAVRPAPASAADSVGSAHVAAYALGGGHGFVLGTVTDRRDGGDHTLAGVAVVLLSLLTTELQGTARVDRTAALVRLLLGAAPDEVLPQLGGGPRTVVHARRTVPGPVDPVAATALGAALGSVLVDPGRDTVRIVLTGGREPTEQTGWHLGAATCEDDAEGAGLTAAETRAARALGRAEATRTPLVRHRTERGGGLASLVRADEAQQHARMLLAPLGQAPALTETLRTWLSLHGSWDRTAVALSVHRNTVRQRIARCARLLDADLDDVDVRMELWFALSRL